MTVGTQYNYSRRNLHSSPYAIPVKNSHSSSHPHPYHNHHHQNGTQNGTQNNNNNSKNSNDNYISGISSLVPTFSRDYVARRISEGETGRLKEELKCEACGKGYKHILSLAKHLWEHTPEWNVTKKLLISKHQQVQLLEAASILVGINEKQDKKGENDDDNGSDDEVDDPKDPKSSIPSMIPKVNLTDIDATVKRESQALFSSSVSSSGYESTKYKRSYSILQYPPSSYPEMQDMPVAGFVGGYFDVREPIARSRQNSEVAYSNEPLVVFSPSPSAKPSSPEDDTDDEEEQVVGRLE